MDAKGFEDAMSDTPGWGSIMLVFALVYLMVAIIVACDAAAAVMRRTAPSRLA